MNGNHQHRRCSSDRCVGRTLTWNLCSVRSHRGQVGCHSQRVERPLRAKFSHYPIFTVKCDRSSLGRISRSRNHPLASSEFFSEMSHTFSLRSQQSYFFNFGRTQPASRRSSNVLSGSTCLRHPRDHPCPQHLALKFCDCPQHLKSQPTRRQRSVNVLFQRNKVNPQRFALF